MPRTLTAAARLTETTGATPDLCRERLHELLTRGGELLRDDGGRAFAFKLHQIISQGRAVYSTLEAAVSRQFSLERQAFAEPGRLFVPIKFCRHCGQDYCLRRGHRTRTTRETRYGVLSLTLQAAGPDAVLALGRGYWGIETRQHYRRDHPQREAPCQVRHPTAARHLARMRSLAIFLYEPQRGKTHGQRSLPDWPRKNHRQPSPLLDRLMTPTG